jgi:large subunit ribosomal protein L29
MLLKAKDLREKDLKDLKTELDDLYNELFEAKMSFHARKLENVSSLKETKKSIARILTVIAEKEQTKDEN